MMKRKRPAKREDSSGVHLWLVFMKAFQALFPHAERSIKRTELGDSDFRVLEVLLHKGPLITRGFGEHAAAMEDVAAALSKNERLTLLRLLKKLGKHAAETRK